MINLDCSRWRPQEDPPQARALGTYLAMLPYELRHAVIDPHESEPHELCSLWASSRAFFKPKDICPCLVHQRSMKVSFDVGECDLPFALDGEWLCF